MEPRILVVDDDEAVGALVEAVLARDGLAVELASDGAAALERLAARSFDLVLADVTMPRVDGPELLRRARERGETVPFLMMSAFLEPAQEARLAAESNVAGVLKKPFEIHALQAAVRAALPGDERAAGAETG